MSSKLKSTRNSPDPIEFKKEPTEEEVQIVEILEQIVIMILEFFIYFCFKHFFIY